MQMNVMNFLSGHFTVGEEHVHPFAAKVAGTQSSSETLCRLRKPSSDLLRQVSQTSSMPNWNNEQMTKVDRLDVHERRTMLVTVYERPSRTAHQDLTKNTVRHAHLKG
jgi:hypothetical protein